MLRNLNGLRRSRLSNSEERYRLLADNTLDVIWLVDFSWEFTYANPAIFKMVGYTPEEWIGSRVSDHCSLEEMHRMQKIFADEVMNPENYEGVKFETIFFHKDGKSVPCEVRARILFNADGIPTCLQGTTRDITDRKIAEAELSATLEDLKRSNSDLEEFAYVASHDLQEPLRVISGYVDLIKRKYKNELDSDMNNYIGFVIDGVHRMQLLIDDLLRYSRVGTRDSSFVSADCETALEDSLSNLKTSIEGSGAIITNDPLPVITTDVSQLTQLFQNLISNAIKFNDKIPHIHVSSEKKGEMQQFSVADNGIGIDSKFFDRIFVIFNRLNSKAEYPGTGLGLSICKKIVEKHGGRIWVNSTVGEGSTFYFTIRGV